MLLTSSVATGCSRKTAQSLMHCNFSTVSRESRSFHWNVQRLSRGI